MNAIGNDSVSRRSDCAVGRRWHDAATHYLTLQQWCQLGQIMHGYVKINSECGQAMLQEQNLLVQGLGSLCCCRHENIPAVPYGELRGRGEH